MDQSTYSPPFNFTPSPYFPYFPKIWTRIVDDECFSDHVIVNIDEPPKATILTVITVIPHDEERALRDFYRAKVLQRRPGQRKMAPRIIHRLVINVNFIIDDLHFFTFQSNNPFDKILRPVLWKNKDDDVPSPRFVIPKKFDIGIRNSYSINKFIDQDVVAHQQRWLH